MNKGTVHKTSFLSASGIKRALLYCCFLLGVFLLGAPQIRAQITGPSTVCSGVATLFNFLCTILFWAGFFTFFIREFLAMKGVKFI